MEINPNFTEKAKRDYKLICAALENNDQSAYAELLHHYNDAIYSMLFKKTNNKDLAEDLTIEAFGKAFKKLNLYTSEFAFSTWLFRIATNNYIDFMRKNKQYLHSLDDKFQEQSEKSSPIHVTAQDLDPEEELINIQKIDIMRNLVDQLKPHYKILIELRYFKEYSYEEIASELDIPLGTVKARLFRARDLLANILQSSKVVF